MNQSNFLGLALGLVIFSFSITALLIVPFINLLYKLKVTRRKQLSNDSKKSLFDSMHAKKAGTPVGGGILLLLVVTILFALIFPIARHMGVRINSSYGLSKELFVIFFTFISFGLLGLVDDIVGIFGKGIKGDRPVGLTFGLKRKHKLLIQFILGGFIGFYIYRFLGIQILHIPFFDKVLNLGIGYIPFAAFIIVFFVNAFNITDGLDGLASGLLMIYLVAFGVIAGASLDTPISIFIALWLGSVIAFLYFNVWPARIFMGDAGALAFGGMIGVIGLITGSIAPLFIIGGVFVIEAISSLIQIVGWKIYKKPLLPIAPLHHTLEAVGWEEQKIVSRAWLAGIMLAIFGLWLATI